METGNNKPIRDSLRNMKINERVSFPVSRLTTVRSTASTLGAEMDRVYKTTRNKLNKSIDVIRTA